MRKGERMKLKEYRKKARRTLGAATMNNILMGIFGEAGEVVDYLKKVEFHGHELERDKLVEELGDWLWYVVAPFNLYPLEGQALKILDGFVPLLDMDGWNMPVVPIHVLAMFVMTETSKMMVFVYECVSFNEYLFSGYPQRTLTIIHELARRVGSDIEEVAALNIAKLEKRYPDGFDQARSINREGYHEGPSS